MKYFEDMTDKYGFSDGSAVPPGAASYRRAYVIVVNTIATELGSGIRLVAFNRMGFHNWCLLYYAPVARTEAYSDEQLATGTVPDLDVAERTQTDDAMELALQIAREMNIDEEYLTVRINLSKAGLKAAIRDAKSFTREAQLERYK